MYRKDKFTVFANLTSQIAGRPSASIVALLITILWLITGPFFFFSDTWQLVMNTITNIVTFLMVFVIQNTQNRDGEAIQIKLDELIRANKNAHNALLDLEELTQEQLDLIKSRYEKLARLARTELAQEKSHKEFWLL
jgi:low affinity Fe/Cu permease